jgi:hypothetical protein
MKTYANLTRHHTRANVNLPASSLDIVQRAANVAHTRRDNCCFQSVEPLYPPVLYIPVQLYYILMPAWRVPEQKLSVRELHDLFLYKGLYERLRYFPPTATPAEGGGGGGGGGGVRGASWPGPPVLLHRRFLTV